MTAALWLAALLAAGQGSAAAPRLLDGFERLEGWSAHPADGVELALGSGRGRHGRALRLDFHFARGGGYAMARKAFALDLPANYAFSFWLRGEAPPNTLEFKLVDPAGENVWWYTERDVVFDGQWRRVTIRRRQISFAWGPLGGGELRRAAALELVITAGRGAGMGSVWIDELMLTPLPEYGPYDLTPRATATSSTTGTTPGAAVDGDTLTGWSSAPGSAPVTLTLYFHRPREYGGITLVWEPGRAASAYTALASEDGRRWRVLWDVREGDGGRDHLYLPNTESRFLRLVLRRPAQNGFGLRELRLEPLEWAASRNAFFAAVARDAPPGLYPRAFVGQRPAWTVVGVDGAHEEALFSEDGALESGQGAFSLEPFLRLGARLVTWQDVQRRLWLERDYLPVPSVRWTLPGLALTITAFAIGPDTASSVIARYRVTNTADSAASVALILAVRPFQVNPPTQFLNLPGGWARVDSIRWDGRRVRVNDRLVVPLAAPGGFGASTFDGGEIAEHLRWGALPPRRAIRDPFGAGSGALVFPLTLAPRASRTVSVELPLVPGRPGLLADSGEAAVERALERTLAGWDSIVGRVTITLPRAGERIERTIPAVLAHVFINRDGPAIQPGSRAYARSWIRDGALTSTALLRFGHAAAVRGFIEWYARHQYPNGKVPCCVDARGADPVPEHDSHGEFIYLIAEYYRHSGDRALVERLWPNVLGAARYLDALRQSRRTAEFESGERRMFFGLLPPSISHEGYSARPMHSYWDDFFALRGFKDAAFLARALGHDADAARLVAMRDEFQRDLYASLDAAMAHHRIDFIPGAADLGDLDATSTTIAVAPGGELARLPRAALERTFERYWQTASARRDSGATWDAYTPYELRTVGTFVRLGWKRRAHALLDGFLDDQEPPGWRQWPEVVWREPRSPRFIGDLPHTWVGADFLRSVADMFAYEREADSALVLGAGIAEAWLEEPGVAVRGLSTWWGVLTFVARREGERVRVAIGEGVRVPPGGIVVVSPRQRPPSRATVDGVSVTPDGSGSVTVRRVPADVAFEN
jgi:hypothetical protein